MARKCQWIMWEDAVAHDAVPWGSKCIIANRDENGTLVADTTKLYPCVFFRVITLEDPELDFSVRLEDNDTSYEGLAELVQDDAGLIWKKVKADAILPIYYIVPDDSIQRFEEVK